MQEFGSRKKDLQFNTGFTLVELILVISIMALLFSFGYANYRDYERRQHLDTAVRMIKSDLRLAQEMALAGKKPSACENLHGYMFQVYPNPEDEQYDIGAFCDTGKMCNTMPPDSGYCIKRREQLPEKVDIEGIGGGDQFYFNVLGRGTNRSSEVIIRLRHPSVATPKTIVVTPAGEIK